MHLSKFKFGINFENKLNKRNKNVKIKIFTQKIKSIQNINLTVFLF